MAASTSHEPRGAPPGAGRYRLVRELGARVVPTWAALDATPQAGRRLVVAERLESGGAYDAQEIDDWIRDARRLTALEQVNVARVRDVVVRDRDALVVSDYVDGVRWSELGAGAERRPSRSRCACWWTCSRA